MNIRRMFSPLFAMLGLTAQAAKAAVQSIASPSPLKPDYRKPTRSKARYRGPVKAAGTKGRCIGPSFPGLRATGGMLAFLDRKRAKFIAAHGAFYGEKFFAQYMGRRA